ncbi:hypothetical protein ACH661_24105 [Klebsiella pneumoniae]|nr:hypothetical protein [Klebsiella pneumoniae]
MMISYQELVRTFLKREGLKELIQINMANALQQITLPARVN